MIGRARTRRKINGRTTRWVRRFRAVGAALGHWWRRSLQLRVVTSTLVLSLLVILILGFALTNQLVTRMLEAKLAAATQQLDSARQTVQRELSGAGETTSRQGRVNSARSALNWQAEREGASGGAGLWTPVLIAEADATQSLITSGAVEQIPESLRDYVRQGQISYIYSTVPDAENNAVPALIVGTPTASDIPALELYLVFPLESEDRSLALMRGTIVTGGTVLLVLLAAISLLVARQVVLPVRSAARIASRFAEGRLKERMPVRGEDDMARLAMSFNEMAESLSRQITQLEEFGNLQKRFTSDVSHELRTPLTTVRMAADVIYDSREDLDPMLERSAELMMRELDRFESLLADLLEISRHDAGVAELSAEQIDVRSPVRAALATVERLASDAHIRLIVDLPDEAIVAEVDPRRVERVVRNLLANAIDHSEGNPVLLRMRADADTMAVIVRDWGVGLKAGEEKLVFNRFWRADPSRVRRSGGTGLGLAISVEDARLHNGRLEAWGERGYGSVFRLALPLQRGRRVTTTPIPLKPDPQDMDVPTFGSDSQDGPHSPSDTDGPDGADADTREGVIRYHSGDSTLDNGPADSGSPTYRGEFYR
ncbi:HAMP domain-containing histidine kinase [Hoyosella rhizosphaerae]|uniref:Sensor histidine kinase MtrB n=1 Tax=Hoyosella rhizosphaerae TaxID=1755582 RepID=A0A916UAY9_9ACTN|nr:MtrAB system histidine kinase MtrB [Hoyosella rhizosphaerae]MBN4925994.1 HAMP domain-containing histidine kinase [Hoyosella rhizosphaerae]GGC66387.1 sensor histidine kinase MtrB [Hoyosella rhizosphaerae]